MKSIFSIGDKKTFERRVLMEDVAKFDGKVVHPVCSTFALARDIEWASRLFVLDMKEDDEEGIGTMLSIEHKSPALVDDLLKIEATVYRLEKNELICDFVAYVGERVIAQGQTGQRVLKKGKIEKLFSGLKNE